MSLLKCGRTSTVVVSIAVAAVLADEYNSKEKDWAAGECVVNELIHLLEKVELKY